MTQEHSCEAILLKTFSLKSYTILIRGGGLTFLLGLVSFYTSALVRLQ